MEWKKHSLISAPDSLLFSMARASVSVAMKVGKRWNSSGRREYEDRWRKGEHLSGKRDALLHIAACHWQDHLRTVTWLAKPYPTCQ
jgi:hypothetical protein